MGSLKRERAGRRWNRQDANMGRRERRIWKGVTFQERVFTALEAFSLILTP